VATTRTKPAALADTVLTHLAKVARRASPDANPYPAAATAEALARKFKTTPAAPRSGSLTSRGLLDREADVYY